MSRATRQEIKVAVRIQTVRAAGRWFESQLETYPFMRDKLDPEMLKFVTRLSRRSGSSLRMDRAFAQSFSQSCINAFAATDHEYLFWGVKEFERRPPVDGVEAVAELVCDITATLFRPEGAPPKLDPVQARDAVQKARHSAAPGQKTQEVQALAASLGVSPNTLEKARRAGEALSQFLRMASAQSPPEPDSQRTSVSEEPRAQGLPSPSDRSPKDG